MAQMTAFETLTLELVNRARLDPLAEAQRLGIDLNQGLAAGTLSGAAKQPLVKNAALVDAARGHSAWMNAADVFSHTGSGGSSFAQRMSAAGYAPLGTFGGGENIAFVGTTGKLAHLASTLSNHDGLFRSAGHRANILDARFREVGIGENEGVFKQGATSFNSLMLTQNFGIRGASVFVGGVAFNDADGDNFYDVGEARGGVAVAVRTTGGALLGSTTGEAAGAYAVALSPQTVAVTFSGAGLPAAVTATVDATQQNAKVDLVGTGKLLSSATITLGAGAVDVTLLGVANINATGNAAANRIEGNKGKNVLVGGAGNDTLVGLADNDVFHGGTGVDRLVGGPGNDLFYMHDVDAAGRLIDTPVEVAGGGIDWIYSTASIDLADPRFVHIENAYAMGTASTALGGSSGANTLVGNGAANVLTGRGGRDVMRGEAGADRFVWTAASDTGKTAATRDLVQDFAVGVDKIDLRLIDASPTLAGDQAFVFRTGVGATFTTGATGQVRFVHEAGLRTLVEVDVSGDRIADFQIELTGLKALTQNDFIL